MDYDEKRARIAELTNVINEGLKAGHKAGVHGCGLNEAGALDALNRLAFHALDESEVAELRGWRKALTVIKESVESELSY